MTERADRMDEGLAGEIALQFDGVNLRPDARARMRERIMNASSVLVQRRDEGEWQPLLPGIAVKTLRCDAQAGTQTSLWQLQPGAVIPSHPHAHEEECLVLEGSVTHAGMEYVAGDYLLVAPGALHGTFTAQHGALLLIRSEMLPIHS